MHAALSEVTSFHLDLPDEPPSGSVLISGDGTTADGQAWQRRDGWTRKNPQDFRWYPAGPYLPGPSADSDYSVKPLMWRQLVAQLVTFTIVWQPPGKADDDAR